MALSRPATPSQATARRCGRGLPRPKAIAAARISAATVNRSAAERNGGYPPGPMQTRIAYHVVPHTSAQTT